MRSNLGRGPGGAPLLLASVGDAEEARTAILGGADILDAKNPAEGSLGACVPAMLRAIVAARDDLAGGPAAWRVVSSDAPAPRRWIPVSAALGDAPDLPGTLALAATGAVACGADDLKVGLRGVGGEAEALRLARAIVGAAREAAPGRRPARVILAAYAEADAIGSLPPRLLPRLAERAGADGCLLDTARKDGRTLLDHLGAADLARILDECRSRGLLCGLAGSLGAAEAALLREIGPDLVGARGALCDGGRRGRLDAARVRDFREALRRPGARGAAAGRPRD